MTVLELDHLCMQIGGVHINRDVSVSLEPGERRALIGPNGAGKTTLMNMAAGVLRPTSGRVRLAGRDVTRMPVHRRARHGLARTFQITNLFRAMTVSENLAIALQARRWHRLDPVRPWSRAGVVWTEVDDLLDRADLAGLRNTPVGSLAYGDQRRLEIIAAVAQPCSVILLDEPGAGLNSAEKGRLLDLIRRIQRLGIAVVLIEPGAGLTSEETESLLQLVFGLDPELAVLFIDHDVDLALRLATHVTVLNLGEVVAHGTPDAVRAMPVLSDIYLGGARAER
jgi:branched-chain amino acid transport system ATP-binding protein